MIEIKLPKVKVQNNKKTPKRCQPKKKLDGSYEKLDCIIPLDISLLPLIWGSFIKKKNNMQTWESSVTRMFIKLNVRTECHKISETRKKIIDLEGLDQFEVLTPQSITLSNQYLYK